MLTRQIHAHKGVARTANQRAKGRPLGFMSSWLAMGQHQPGKEEHWAQDNTPDHATRLVAGLSLSASSSGRQLLEKERLQHDGEGDEPAGLP